ncbi:MAG: GNAT family N-acetyltransferase [Chloroflexi bacterium]|nr:GNAT family N-acetyltransferase [Ardenticatenaceae bacterium]NOG37454.1 GNAT family N-acetyltransferase [Chloroflexota bacterium]
MEIMIREATLADEDGLDLLYTEIDRLHHEALPQVFRGHEEAARPSTFLAAHLADDTMRVFVADVNGRLVGLILLKIRSEEHPIKYSQHYLHISTLIVAAEFQGQGVAQRLMDTAVTFARERGVSQLRLNVYNFNQRAIAFYEKEGFTTLSRHMWKKL